MISSKVTFVDIDPFQWGNLKEIAELTGDRYITAHVLYHKTDIVNVFIENHKNQTDNLADGYRHFATPREIAQTIFVKHPDITRVETYELAALQSYSRQISFDSDAMDSDVYFNYCRQIKSNLPGFHTFYKNPPLHRLDIFDFLHFLEKNNPQNYYFGIGLYTENGLYFSVILEISGGKVVLISTFEYLQKFGITMPLFNEHPVFAPVFREIFGHDGEVAFFQVDLLHDLSRTANQNLVLQKAIQDGKAIVSGDGLGLLGKFLGNGFSS